MIADSVLDAALNKLATATTIHITKAEYTTLAEVTANSAASYAPAFSAPEDNPAGGRRILRQEGVDPAAEANADIANGGGYRYFVDDTEILHRQPTGDGSVSVGQGGSVTDEAGYISIGDPTFTQTA